MEVGTPGAAAEHARVAAAKRGPAVSADTADATSPRQATQTAVNESDADTNDQPSNAGNGERKKGASRPAPAPV